MLIKRLVLENVRSYMSETIEFPAGSILISGDIGAGKSTILLAIEFALFGTLRGDLSGDSLLRNGEKKGSVQLFFNVGKEIEIFRSLSRSKYDDVSQGAGYICIDGVKIDCTAVELKSRVLELLGYPSELLTKSKSLIYRYTVYTPQEMMKQILFDDVENRLNVLRKVFGIDKYRRIRENSSVYVRHLRDVRNRIEGEISSFSGIENDLVVKKEMLVKIDLALDLISSEINSKNKEVVSAKEILDLSMKDVEELNKFRNELKFVEQMIFDKNRIVSSSETRMSLLSKEISELEKTLKLLVLPSGISKIYIENEIISKEKRLNTALVDKTRLSERISFLERSISDYETRIKVGYDRTVRLSSMKEELKMLKNNVSVKSSLILEKNKFESDYNIVVSKIAELNSYMANSSNMKSGVLKLINCPTCYQVVGKEHKERIVREEGLKVSNWQNEIFGLSQKQEALKIKLNSIEQRYNSILKDESSIAGLLAEINNLDLLLKDVKVYEMDLEKFRAELKVMREKRVSDAEITILSENITQLRSDLNKFSQRENLSFSLADKQKYLSELSSNLLVVKDEIAKLETSKLEIMFRIKNLESSSVFSSAKAKYDLLLDEHKKLEIKRAGYLRDKEYLLSEIVKIETNIKLVSLKKEKLEFVNDVVNWFGTFFVSVSELIEKQILLRTYNEFNELFVLWFDKLLEDDLITVRLDDSFTPIVIQNGYETSLSDLSGGEKTACSLAYRLALNKVINDVMSTINTSDLIILDEPTDGFSSEQLDRVKDVLDDLGMKQIIIVSHEPKIETYVDHVIRVVKDEHVSKVV